MPLANVAGRTRAGWGSKRLGGGFEGRSPTAPDRYAAPLAGGTRALAVGQDRTLRYAAAASPLHPTGGSKRQPRSPFRIGLTVRAFQSDATPLARSVALARERMRRLRRHPHHPSAEPAGRHTGHRARDRFPTAAEGTPVRGRYPIHDVPPPVSTALCGAVVVWTPERSKVPATRRPWGWTLIGLTFASTANPQQTISRAARLIRRRSVSVPALPLM